MAHEAAQVAGALYAAVARGDEQAIRARLDPAIRWRGRERGHLWWRHASSCHGQAEALRNFHLLRHKVPHFRVAAVMGQGDAALVALGGHPPDGRFAWFPLVTVREGRVVEIRDYGRRRSRALRALNVAADD